jgi:hypothetical protein
MARGEWPNPLNPGLHRATTSKTRVARRA